MHTVKKLAQGFRAGIQKIVWKIAKIVRIKILKSVSLKGKIINYEMLLRMLNLLCRTLKELYLKLFNMRLRLNIKFKFGSDFQKRIAIGFLESVLVAFGHQFSYAHKGNKIEWDIEKDLSDCCGEKIIKGRCRGKECGENA